MLSFARAGRADRAGSPCKLSEQSDSMWRCDAGQWSSQTNPQFGVAIWVCAERRGGVSQPPSRSSHAPRLQMVRAHSREDHGQRGHDRWTAHWRGKYSLHNSEIWGWGLWSPLAPVRWQRGTERGGTMGGPDETRGAVAAVLSWKKKSDMRYPSRKRLSMLNMMSIVQDGGWPRSDSFLHNTEPHTASRAAQDITLNIRWDNADCDSKSQIGVRPITRNHTR